MKLYARSNGNKGCSVLLSLLVLFAIQSLGVSAKSMSEIAEQAIRSALGDSRPDLEILSIQSSRMSGLYEVVIGEGATLYFSEDGGYFILGDLFRVDNQKLVNLDDIRRNKKRSDKINTVEVKDMIVFSPEGKARAVINVFTDVDCFYCQKLHKEVPALNQMGVEVRYLAYPRAGINSESYRKIATAWCAVDPQDAITRIKNGENLADNVCTPNPVADQFLLGQQVGVRGTPAMILESGEMLPGYMPALELGRKLGIN
jgi:thiol:disulfide interchange protein DsbC